jgi:hypothetical protein
MFHALIWLLVVSLLAVWSLGAWVSHGLVAWVAAQAGTVSVAAVGGLTLPAWLAPWVPTEWIAVMQALITAAAPTIDAWLTQAPSAVGWLTAGVWVVWALGALALVLVGGALSALVAVVRRSTAAPLPSAPQAPA